MPDLLRLGVGRAQIERARLAAGEAAGEGHARIDGDVGRRALGSDRQVLSRRSIGDPA